MMEIDVAAVRGAFESASSLAEWSTIAVAVGVFIELVALFVFSKEMPPIEKKVLVTATILIVAGCAGEFIFGSRANTAASQLQQASDQKIAILTKDTTRLSKDIAGSIADTARANEAAAKANERAAELKLALEKEVAARQPRHITEEQKLKIIDELSRSPKGKVFVVGSFFDAESRQFAEEITAVLKAGGFEVPEMPQRPNRPIGYTSPGAWLWVHDLNDSTAPHALAIQNAFKAAGWYFDGQAHPELLEIGEIMIAVSSHP